MKIVLETRKGTKEREKELTKFKRYLTHFYKNDEDPFCCVFQCENFDGAEKCKKCVEDYIEKRTEEIDEEGVWYL